MSAAGARHGRMGAPRTGSDVPCQQCGTLFYRQIGAIGRKFCSLKCHKDHLRSKRINLADETAKCAKCSEWKPFAEFVVGRDKLPHSYCKPCSRAWFEQRRRRLGARPMPSREESQRRAKQYKYEYNKRAFHMRRAAGQYPTKFEMSRMMCEQDAKCAYCKTLLPLRGFHVDHKLPVSRGGTNDRSNLHLTCARCNLLKRTMTHEEFLASKKRRPVQWK